MKRIFIFILLLFSSCEKTPVNWASSDSISTQNLADSKVGKGFDSIIVEYDKLVEEKGEQIVYNRVKLNEIFPVWDLYWEGKFNSGIKKIIPLGNSLKSTVNVKLADGTSQDINNLTFLLVSGNSEQGFTFELVTKIPDSEHLLTNDLDHRFSGMIWLKDLKKEQTSYFIGKDGNFKSFNSSAKSNQSRKQKVNDEICVDWFTCVSAGGQLIDCHYNYTECWDNGGGGGGSGTGPAENLDPNYGDIGEYYPKGGSHTPGVPNNPKEFSYFPKFNLCPPSASKWTTTSTDYKVSMSGLGGTFINYQYPNIFKSKIYPIDFGDVCITIPKSKAPDVYSAATFFAASFNAAKADIYNELTNNTLGPSSAAIKNRFKALIRIHLGLYGMPSYSFGIGSCGGTVQFATADYGC